MLSLSLFISDVNYLSLFSHSLSQCTLGREPFPLPPAPAPACIETESYYEDPQPYDPISINGTSRIGSQVDLNTHYLLWFFLYFDVHVKPFITWLKKDIQRLG